MKSGLIFLVLLLLAIPISLSITNASTNQKTLSLNIKGPIEVFVNFLNGSYAIINKTSTIHFVGNITISITVPFGYTLYVNGTEQPSGIYYAKVYSSETIYLKAIPQYARLTVNLIGNGDIALYIYNESDTTILPFPPYILGNNYTKVIVNHNETFNIFPPRIFVELSSNNSFIVNNDGVVTNFYDIVTAVTNVTLNINFNVQEFNYSPSKYASIRINLPQKSNFTLILSNQPNGNDVNASLITYTLFVANKSTTVIAPLGSLLWLFSLSNKTFYVNNNNSFGNVYVANVTHNMTLFISFSMSNTTTQTNITTTNTSTTTSTTTTSTTVSTTTTTSTKSTTTPTQKITPTSTTIQETSSSSRHSIPIYYLIIIVIIAIFLIIFLLMRKRSEKEELKKSVRRRRRD